MNLASRAPPPLHSLWVHPRRHVPARDLSERLDPRGIEDDRRFDGSSVTAVGASREERRQLTPSRGSPPSWSCSSHRHLCPPFRGQLQALRAPARALAPGGALLAIRLAASSFRPSQPRRRGGRQGGVSVPYLQDRGG